MINSRVRFRTQRRCFRVLIRPDPVGTSDSTFSLMGTDPEYSQNIRSRSQVIRGVLRIWWPSSISPQHFRYRRLGGLVGDAKTQVENHQELHHDVTLCLRRSRIFRSHRLQRAPTATRDQWDQAYVWRERKAWKKGYHSWHSAWYAAVFRYSHQKECNLTRRILLGLRRLSAYRWVYMIKCWSYSRIQQVMRYSLLDDLLRRSSHFDAFCFEDRPLSQGSLDIHCGHWRCRLCGDLITQPLRAFFDSDVCFPVSDRSVKTLQCRLRHHHTTQDDYESWARWQLFKSLFSSKRRNWDSQRERFWRSDSTFRKMKVRSVSVVHRVQQEVHSSCIATSSGRLSCFLFAFLATTSFLDVSWELWGSS